jgi:uncharacterized protein (TIGR02145 family)
MKKLILFFGIVLLFSCKKDDTPTDTITVTDVDGNVYNTVMIGTQVWMKENLKTTKYNNGDLIGTTSPATLDIYGEDAAKYQWAYDGNESNVATYGRLYTWYAVTDSRNLCPTGWHVPSDAEWTALTDYLTNNGYGYEGSGGDIAKSMASSVGNDQGSNNRSGFTALQSGCRLDDGTFVGVGFGGYWWSSTEDPTLNAYSREIYCDKSSVFNYLNVKQYGFSVRCLKD